MSNLAAGVSAPPVLTLMDVTMHWTSEQWNEPLMGNHEAELDALYDIAAILARRGDQRETLERILEILKTRFGVIRGAIVLAGGAELTVEPAAPAPVGAPVRSPNEAIGEKVFATGQVAVVTRIAGVDGLPGDLLSSVGIPIVVANEVIGTLSAEVPYREGAALERAKKLLAIVAGLIAGDVNNRRVARLERETLETENQRLRSALREQYRPDGIIGNSRAMREVYARIHQLAASEIPMLIRGEAGSGKELIASAIHYHSPRAGGPLVRVSCLALSEALIESELFGHERGAYAGAPYRKPGRIEEAEGGTLFLDEIGDFSPAIQIRLLRLIQDREYERMGGSQVRKANVRVIAATSRDLEIAVQAGRFRQDLYYRINVFPIHLPPLRERKDDVLLLANAFIERYAGLLGKTIRRISTPAINMLMAYHWPGNVRELENCIEHAVLMSTDEVIHGHNLPPTLQFPDDSEQTAGTTLKQQIHALERDMIVDALKRTGGSINLASKELGITGRMVRYKIKQLEIDYKGLFSRRALKA